jgi:hypothetical protein
MDAALVIDDPNELVALHRALFEAQFAVDPHDRDVPGSPILAALANRVVDALTQIDPRWSEWRDAEKHPDRVAVAARHLHANPSWASWSDAERERQVRNHLAPLVASTSLVAALCGSAA